MDEGRFIGVRRQVCGEGGLDQRLAVRLEKEVAKEHRSANPSGLGVGERHDDVLGPGNVDCDGLDLKARGRLAKSGNQRWMVAIARMCDRDYFP